MAKARTSAMLATASGSLGGLVAVRGRSGLVLQAPKTFRRAVSPAQREAMDRMERAGRAWNDLSAASVAEWRRYAAGLVHHNALTGEPYAPLAFNVFCGLFCKLQQIDPAAPVPLHPPTGGFVGDSVVVTVGPPSQDGSFLRGGQGGEQTELSGPLPQPPLQDEPLGEGAIVYTASTPNRAGVLTEILYQRLPGPHRLPKPAYKSAGFKAFAAGSLAFTLPLEKGWYACAYHFVEAATGRTTLTMPLGTVSVAGA